MKKMIRTKCENEVNLSGRVVEKPKYHHSDKWNEYYEFFVASKRNSGIDDIIPVIATKDKVENLNMNEGDRVVVSGDYRSYTRLGIKKLELYVFANSIEMREDAPCNNIVLEGYVCKKSKLRITPLTERKILEIIVASNRGKDSTSYIPCIIWGIDEKTAEDDFAIGKLLKLYGRVQSREYQKVYESGETESKVAYEVSVRRYYNL